jgi:hypothetical protein
MLFFKINPECYPGLMAFLVYLNRMPEEIELNKVKILSSNIQIDMHILEILREL